MNKVMLIVDDERTVYSLDTTLSDEIGVFMHEIIFGGNIRQPDFVPGLIACFRSLKVDGKRIDIDSDDVDDKVGHITHTYTHLPAEFIMGNGWILLKFDLICIE